MLERLQRRKEVLDVYVLDRPDGESEGNVLKVRSDDEIVKTKSEAEIFTEDDVITAWGRHFKETPKLDRPMAEGKPIEEIANNDELRGELFEVIQLAIDRKNGDDRPLVESVEY